MLKGAETHCTLVTVAHGISFYAQTTVKSSSSLCEPRNIPFPSGTFLPLSSAWAVSMLSLMTVPVCFAFMATDEAAQPTLWLPATCSLLPAHPRTRSISCCLWQLPLLHSPCYFSLLGVKGSFQDTPLSFLCNPGISLINSTCAGSVMSIWLQAFISVTTCAQHEVLSLRL